MNGSLYGAEPVAVLLAAVRGGRRPPADPQRRYFGYFCSYWPEELLLAAGLEPLRLLPPETAGTPACLPAFCCLPARACLAAAEAGELDALAGVGFAHSCDTVQCLTGIWPHRTRLFFVPPATPLAPGAEVYLRGELHRLWRQLAAAAGVQPEEEALRRAVALMNGVRLLAGRLDEMRPGLPSPLTAALLRAGQLMPRADYAAALEAALPLLADAADEPGGRRRLVLSGSLLESDGLYMMFEELGARVVADDTCTGYRHFAVTVDEGVEPLAGLAARCAARPPCPCRHPGPDRRADYLLDLAGRRGAQGVVLALRKYCDPHAWDAVAVGERLRRSGLPVLVLEMEAAAPGGQERTRLQAFLESL